MGVKRGSEARFQAASDQALLIYFDREEEQSGAETWPLQKQTTLGSRAETRPLHNQITAESRGECQPFQSRITLRAHEKVRRLLRLLELEPIAGVRNLHPAYCSLLVKFDGLRWRNEELEKKLRGYLERLEEVRLPEPKLVEIPVCYGGEFGPDLNDVAALHGMTPEQVIGLHAATTYLVYFMGFVPGFAYLGELPQALVTPRLATPRKKVPAGSVGIAGNQTGVYPFATPGGWRLLGRTPLEIFRADRKELSLILIGDRVRFLPIGRERFAQLERA
jgi:inhibitor of KinA